MITIVYRLIPTDTNVTHSGNLFVGTYMLISDLAGGSYFDINYTCVVDQNASPGSDIDNNVTLISYYSTSNQANQNQNTNFVQKEIISEAKLMMTSKMEIVKNIVGSSIPDTDPNNNLNQGEIVNFEINVTLGEGTYTNYALTDNTCTGLTLQAQSANVVVNGTTVTILGTGGSVDGTLSYGCEKQAIASGTNTATVTADLMGSPTASTSWAVTAPNVVTSKNMNPSRADAGDTVTVTMNWTNDTSNPAYKCSVIDPLNTSIFDITTVSITTTPTGYTCNLVGNEVQCIYTGDLTLPCPNGPAEFTVNVRDDVNTSTTLVNELSFKGVTLPGGHVGENNTTINGSVESNATDTLRLRSPSRPIKIFTATSENFTDPGDVDLNSTPPVAVGEVIDVQITYGFWEGTTLNVRLEDFFETEDLVYIPGTMKISRSDAGLSVGNTAINTSLSGVTVGTFVSVNDSQLLVNNNSRIQIGMDNVHLNSTGTSRNEQLTWKFRVKVQNEPAVQASHTVIDRGRVRFVDSVSGANRSSISLRRNAVIVEPLPTIKKDANQTTVQAGSSLKYTIQVCNDEQNTTSNNQHATSAFNWIISDRIPDDIDLISGPVIDTNSTGATVDTSASSGQDINATIDRLHRGQCISINYDAKVKTTAQYGQIMTNTAKYQTTSLPGTYGSETNLTTLTNTLPGELNGKRTGTGNVNDLFGHNDKTVTVDQGIMEKVLLSHAGHYAIGEQAHYQVVIGLPKGESNNFKVIDTLPAGLHYESATANVIIGPNVSITGTPIPAQESGNIITFDFGDINTTTVSSLHIDYNVTIENNLSNQDGTPLTNSVKTTYDDPNTAGSITIVPPNLPTITVGEPNLEIQKSITAGAVKAQAGKTVSWKVVLSNANNAHTTAYAVDWIDTLPSHLAQISNYSLSTTGTAPVLSGTSTPLDTSALSENNTTLSLALFDLPVGSTVTVTFDSIVQNDAVAGETQTNDTNASYLSMLGADGSLLGGRNSDNCGDDDNNSNLNNYCESTTADLIIDAGISIDKHLQGTVTHFTIGQPGDL